MAAIDCLRAIFYSLCSAAVVLIVFVVLAPWNREAVMTPYDGHQSNRSYSYMDHFLQQLAGTDSDSWNRINISRPYLATVIAHSPNTIQQVQSPPSTQQHTLTVSTSGHTPYDMTGYLNYDIWHWVVGYLVDDLRIYREFPQYPDKRSNTSQLHAEFNEVDPADVRGRYGHKMYGYLIPPKSGSYSFKVELTEMTAAASVELWISSSSNPLHTRKILALSYTDLNRQKRYATKSQKTEEVKFKGGEQYYIEFLEKATDGKVVADVKWKVPSSGEYVSIPSKYLAMAMTVDGDGGFVEGQTVEQLLSGPLPSNKLQTNHRVKSPADDLTPVTTLHVLPDCEFHSLTARPRKVKTYTGIRLVHQSSVYPKDQTWFSNKNKAEKGNPVIPKQRAESIVSMYSRALNASKEVQGTVVGLHYLEETLNGNGGSRFLLEMDVQLHQPHQELVRTSEYVYLKKDSSQLCHTSNFQWAQDVEVYFVVSVKNLGLWVKHLIYNMESIYNKTKDENFSLIIVDYESEDMDIEQEAKKSSFQRITVLHQKGGFSRSRGLQAGIDYVKDGKSIVMTIDMHLTLPTGLVRYVRKHTVQYKMAFTPMFFRLNKGYTEINYNGFWETLTYGLFAMYKSDWTTSGGFNTIKFTTKWGGEDWDLLDKVMAKGFEAFRIRPPGLVHYHHTRTGLWGNKDIKFKKKWTLQAS